MKRVGITSRISTLALVAATSAIGISGPGFAQSQDGDGQIAAAEAPQPGNDDVVVTAQRRDTKLLETPVSIGVLSGSALDASSARDAGDALADVAGVSINRSQAGSTTIAVRGVTSSAGTSTTGFYVDEVPFSFVRLGTIPDPNVYDLARIEVLRGPQGTLYGANSLNGVVRIITNDADLNALEGKGRGRLSGTREGGANWSADAALNIPIIEDRLAVRGVVSVDKQSGFINSRTDGGRDINGSRSQNYRLKVTAKPVEDLTLKATVSHSVSKSDAPTLALRDLTTIFSTNRRSNTMFDVYNLLAVYDGSSFSILSSTSLLRFKYFTINEAPGLRVDNRYKSRSFSQEVRVSSKFDGPLQFSVGGLFRDAKDTNSQDARPNPLYPGVYRVTDLSKSFAVFGDATYQLMDGKIELTGGLRYFHDRNGLSQQSDFNPALAPLPLREQTFEKVTGRALIAYKPQPDAMIYASYSTGFRSGFFQAPATVRVAPNFGNVSPDTIANYEVGTKGRLFGNSVTYEAAVYFMKWDDIQQLLRVPEGFNARVNAGGADGWGAEGSISIKASSTLSLNATLGWNDLRFNESTTTRVNVASAPGGFILVPLFVKGSRINDSPEWTGSVGATFRSNIGDSDVQFVGSSNLSFGSPRLLRFLTGTVLSQAQSSEITDLSLNLGVEAPRWSLGLFVDNLLDERDPVTAPDAAGQGGAAVILRPRTIGVQGTIKF